MKNPWKSVLLSTYEAHMALSNVQQLQTLNEITREQLHQYPVNSIAILGVAGGNGLEHINQKSLRYRHQPRLFRCMQNALQESKWLPRVDTYRFIRLHRIIA